MSGLEPAKVLGAVIAWGNEDERQIDYITRKAVTGREYEERFSRLGGLL